MVSLYLRSVSVTKEEICLDTGKSLRRTPIVALSPTRIKYVRRYPSDDLFLKIT